MTFLEYLKSKNIPYTLDPNDSNIVMVMDDDLVDYQEELTTIFPKFQLKQTFDITDSKPGEAGIC